MDEIMNISGVDCYEKGGMVYLKLEAVARGLGFTTIAASGNEVVRWNAVYGYLTDLKVVAGSCNGNYRENCPEFIPENVFYRLAMKAKNETAEKFQAIRELSGAARAFGPDAGRALSLEECVEKVIKSWNSRALTPQK